MKCHRKFAIIPKIILSEYILEMQGWWTALQPVEQVVSDGGGLQQQVSEDIDWSSVAKSGSNGFFIFMMTLAWWVKSANTLALLAEFDSFIGGVNWVLSMILKVPPGTSGKCPHLDDKDDEDQQPPRKQ